MEIGEFQGLVERIYFERDRRRGIPRNYMRFVEEVGELSQALFYDDRDNIAGEFADTFAWLVSLASQAGVRMEEAISKYTGGCPSCDAIPCTCPEQ